MTELKEFGGGEVSRGLGATKGRLLAVMIGFLLSFSVIFGRLGHLMIFQADEDYGGTGSSKSKTLRADIVDRNGVVLATSLVTQSLYANPKVVIQHEETARQLCQLFPELNQQDLLKKLKSTLGFIWIKRNLTPKQQNAVCDLGLPGVGFQREEKRVYPHGPLAAHVLGSTDVDGIGVSGLEKYFNEALMSRADPLKLSMDIRVQHVLREEIAAKIQEFNAIGGAGLVMNVETSEVIALSSLPDYDPHNLKKSRAQDMFNAVTLGVYELGSSMKILTTALALESGAVSLNSRYDISQPIRVGRFQIKDYHRENDVSADVSKIFLRSSNIGMVRMIQAVGVGKHQEFMRKFGLFEAPSLELPEVGKPIIPTSWKEVNSMTMAYGYGFSVSPIQAANAVCASINGGTLHPVTLLKLAGGQEVPGRQVISAQNSAIMRDLLRLTVQHGTGRKADATGYDVGGKTGTAEKVEKGRYTRENIVTFISAFPMVEPKYLVMVMVDKPKGNKTSHGFRTAGWIAAPAVKNIVSRIGPLLGVDPVVPEEATSPQYEIFKASLQVGGQH